MKPTSPSSPFCSTPCTLLMGAVIVAAVAIIGSSPAQAEKYSAPAPVFTPDTTAGKPQSVEAIPDFTIPPLTTQDKEDLKQVEEYFNTMPPVQAKFTQRAQQWNGKWDTQTGTFLLFRPGKLRITYDKSDDFIVADGKMIYNWDASLHQQSQTRIEKTLAGFILQHDLSFSGDDITVTKVEHTISKSLEITIRSASQPESGELTLIMDEKPLGLEGWRVLDAQGLNTEVSLSAITMNPKFKDKDFVFINPDFGNTR